MKSTEINFYIGSTKYNKFLSHLKVNKNII